MNAPKPLQIFKPGRHVAMSGAVLEFSEADLAASAAAYDPAISEAPLVVGHPKLDSPAYGWVKALSGSAALEAVPHQVDPAFADMVNRGVFKKVSAAFYAPDAPNNPVPGVYYLRHVGFLGAQPPAVKGLRSPEFADAEEGIVEFSEWDDVDNAGLWRRMREWIIGKFGQDEADRVIPGYTVQSLEQGAQDELRESQTESTPAPLPAFSDPITQETNTVTPEEKARLEDENARLRQQLSDTQARDRKARLDALHADHAAFAEALVGDGTLLPAQVAVAVATLDHLACQEAPVEFGEGDAKAPLIDAIKGLLSSLPKQLVFSESATHGKAVAGNGGVVEFASPDRMSVDGARLAVHQKALDYQAAHPGTDYLAAVKAVS